MSLLSRLFNTTQTTSAPPVVDVLGVGGGFLIVPALVLVLGLPMPLAVGTSLVAISLNALWGIIGNLQLGTLDWTLTLLFAAGGVLGVLAGGKLAGRLPYRARAPRSALVSRASRCTRWAAAR